MNNQPKPKMPKKQPKIKRPVITSYDMGKGVCQFLPFHLPQRKIGKWQIFHKMEPAGRTLPVVGLRNAIFMGLPPTTMTIDKPHRIHQLLEDKGVWMQAIPQEIEQAERQLAGAHGHVLTGGLGLGLAVAILQKNPRVKSITVVEKSEDVISLVKPYLPNRKTRWMIHDCLFNHIKKAKEQGRKYDFAFYDIWAPTGEMAFGKYVWPLRRLSVGVIPQDQIQCWNEDEMLGQVQMNMQHQAAMIGHSIPGWVPIADMKREQFDKMATDKHAKKMRQDWAFWVWARKQLSDVMQPVYPLKDLEKRLDETRTYIIQTVPAYMKALKDPELYDRVWKVWEP